jgi:hypothetical protein
VVKDLRDIGKVGSGFVSVDELYEIDIGSGEQKRPTYLNANLMQEQKAEVGKLLKEFVDCFTWDYTEIPGLSQDLVEHRLPIKRGFRPYKRSTRSFNPGIVVRIKEEVDRLLQVRFIHPCGYVEWISNMVPMEKKIIGKIRVCVLISKLEPRDTQR